MPAIKEKIDSNLRRIRQNVADACARVRRDPDEIALVAVTKSADMEGIKAVLDLGVTDLGESRVQQLVERAAETAQYIQRRQLPPARWHMIGHLQRNKVKAVIPVAQVIHSVDSLRLAEEINVRAEKQQRLVDVLMEVNCSGEPQKFGVAVGAASHLAELLTTLRHIRLIGLMTMAPLASDPEQARPSFVRLRELFEDMRHEATAGKHFCHLSMGMSQDYTVAVEEGATILRIGSALFE